MENGTFFFRNDRCEYFPCHRGLDEEEFNCMFCYCPLYMLGRSCGGEFEYTKSGVKSCMNCTRPHDPKRWNEMNAALKTVVQTVREEE